MKSFKLLPSVDRLATGAVAALKRFPLALTCAVVGSIVAAIQINQSDLAGPSQLIDLIAALSLGLPLFFALTLIAEKRDWKSRLKWAVQGVGMALLALYYWTLPPDILIPHSHLFRFVMLWFGLHSFVAIGPFLGKAHQNGFWQYNKSLLLGLLTAILYSAALFVGFAVALAAADYLFGISINPKSYAELWVLMAGSVNTWIFLALVPTDLGKLETDETYPNGLKIFSQYVLLPLVGLYFVILFAYEAKVIIEWNWPKGLVSQLVLCYSVVGILSILLLHPLRDRSENKWIARFGDWFFRLSVPLVVMLFLAIRRRIADYGVTEPRYLVLILSIGLSIVVIYFIFSRRRDIRVIPIVLVVLAVIGAYGPLSASSVSTWSQSSRLENLLVKNGLWKDGTLTHALDSLSFESRQELSSVLAYLNESQGPGVFSRWLPDSVIAKAKETRDTTAATKSHVMIKGAALEDLATALGFQYEGTRYFGVNGRNYWLTVEEAKSIDISGFDQLVTFGTKWRITEDTSLTVQFSDYECRIRTEPHSPQLTILFQQQGDTVTDKLSIDLSEMIDRLAQQYGSKPIPQDSAIIERTAGAFDARILVKGLGAEKRTDRFEINSLRAQILIRKHK